MKLQTLLRGIAVTASDAAMDTEITGVSYDSRTTKPGDLFVAVSGYATDGHKYIPMAVERGAAAVLCEHSVPEGTPWVQTPSARAALAQLGCNWYGHPADVMQMIGVTGTNGKTSITCLVKEILETACGAKVGLIGTIQNMIGGEVLETERTTPESFELQGLLARMRDAGCTHVVMEVSSHALALHRVDGIQYQVGAFTNLTEDHLDFHKTMEEYRKAKAKLFTMCEKGVFNADDPATPQMIADATCEVYTVGTRDASLLAEHIELGSDHALGIVRQLGVSLADAAKALGRAQGVKGRVEVVPTPGKPFTVLIDYAHTPDGLENVLRSVKDYCKGRVILVFGCGGDRDRTKRPIMGRIAECMADFCIVTSDNPRTEEPEAIIDEIVGGMKKTNHTRIENRREAIGHALDMAKPGDFVLIAGKGHEMYQEIQGVRHPFDEREVVRTHLQGKGLLS